MQDKEKTREQRITELVELRQRMEGTLRQSEELGLRGRKPTADLKANGKEHGTAELGKMRRVKI